MAYFQIIYWINSKNLNYFSPFYFQKLHYQAHNIWHKFCGGRGWYIILSYTLQAPVLEEGRMARNTFFLKRTGMVVYRTDQRILGSAVACVANFWTSSFDLPLSSHFKSFIFQIQNNDTWYITIQVLISWLCMF